MFEALSPAELEKRFVSWVSTVCSAVTGRVIAIDGKVLRGSGSVGRGQRALHLVSAYAAEYGLTLGQRVCEGEIQRDHGDRRTAEVLALEGAVVTIDAMGCQTAIAEQITQAKGHYVLAVKDNQRQLADALRDFFATLSRPGYPGRVASTFETLDKGPRAPLDASLRGGG